MKFKQFLNEITKLSNEEIDKIIDNGFKEYEKIVKNYKWWPFKYIKLMKSFKKYNIYFYVKDGFLSKIFGIDENIRGITTITDDVPKVYIGLTKEQVKNLNNASGIKKIKKKLKGILSHELIHAGQRSQMKDEYINFLRKNTSKIKAEMRKMTYDEYISSKQEIEAFAREAVNDIENNNFDIVFQYMDLKDKKIKKRFLKKLYQYMDMYGSIGAKTKLRIKMSGKLKDISNDEFYASLNYIDKVINRNFSK